MEQRKTVSNKLQTTYEIKKGSDIPLQFGGWEPKMLALDDKMKGLKRERKGGRSTAVSYTDLHTTLHTHRL